MIQPHQWLVKRDGKWGCLICSTACKKDALDGRPMQKWRYVAFARYDVVHLKIGNVRRHEKCRAHRAAMQALGLSPADIQDDDDDAPTIEATMSFLARPQSTAPRLPRYLKCLVMCAMVENIADSSGALQRHDDAYSACSSRTGPLAA